MTVEDFVARGKVGWALGLLTLSLCLSVMLLRLTSSKGESNCGISNFYDTSVSITELFLRMLLIAFKWKGWEISLCSWPIFLYFFQAYFLFHLPDLTPLMDTLVCLNLSFNNLLFFPMEVCTACFKMWWAAHEIFLGNLPHLYTSEFYWNQRKTDQRMLEGRLQDRMPFCMQMHEHSAQILGWMAAYSIG